MKLLSASFCSLAILFFAIGCDPPADKADSSDATMVKDGGDDHDDHDGHDHGDHGDHDHDSITMSDVLETLTAQSAAIEEAFANDSPGDAHDEMHAIGHTIEDLVVAAKNDGMDDEAKEKISMASEKLMDAFGALDEGLHGGEKTTFVEVESEIDSAMKSIMELVDAKM